MKRFATFAVLGAVALAVTLSVGAWGKGHGKAKGHQKPKGHTVTVIEHATTDATTNPGQADGTGDVLTFANDVFDANDSAKVGSDQGYCIRVVAGQSYECNFTTFLPKGQITVEGPFFDTKDDNTLAITGGTGRYRHVRGTMDLQTRDGGTKFAFVFHLNS